MSDIATYSPLTIQQHKQDTMAEAQRKGKPKKFNSEWRLKYGLEISTRDPTTS
jgi:hypothetical protein